MRRQRFYFHFGGIKVPLSELTLEQREFAEQNHDLVYSFLRDNNLDEDGYYDVVVFGYLRAAQKYVLRPGLRQRREFSAVARQAMGSDLRSHIRSQRNPMRRADTVSLEPVAHDGRQPAAAEAIPDCVWPDEKWEAHLLWGELAQLLTCEQAELLRMRADGYTDREIAASKNWLPREVEDMLASIQAAALALRLA
jgi:RNA polymerase sigma-70 factor (ECF subfamily)